MDKQAKVATEVSKTLAEDPKSAEQSMSDMRKAFKEESWLKKTKQLTGEQKLLEFFYE